MDYLPLFYDIKNQPCLVVGGGEIACRKAGLLFNAGATITVVAPVICDNMRALTAKANVTYLAEQYSAEKLQHMVLVIAATDDDQVNKQVSLDAKAQHIPVNVVDNPQLCSFIMPAIVDRSPIMIAISSGGASPVLTRILRSKIEPMIPSAYGRLAELVGKFRYRVKQKFESINQRRDFWEKILVGPVAELVFSGQDSLAESTLQRMVDGVDGTDIGEVYLVGAGPGDPDLLTFRALRLMQQADVVLYDRLVSAPILELTRRDAEKIYVGKARSDHAVPQQDINQLLVKLAKDGRRVLRLKGGDPFIFGRGGEEIEELAENNVPFQVVPGITAASGCASYAGIPLTHRDYAQSVRFVTGHLKNGTTDLPWQELVQTNQTLVFYMGLAGIDIICQQLIDHGRSKETPIALVQQGTMPQQRVLVATLSTMAELVATSEVRAPTIIIVGEVVLLQEKLTWFHNEAVQR